MNKSDDGKVYITPRVSHTKIDYITRDPQHDSDKNYSPVKRFVSVDPNIQAKKEKTGGRGT